MKIFNLFKRKPKAYVILDLSEIPDDWGIDKCIKFYKEHKILLVSSNFKGGLNSKIITI